MRDFWKMVLFGIFLAYMGILAIFLAIDYYLDGHIFIAALLGMVGYSLLSFKVKYSYRVNIDFSNEGDEEDE
ncbi:MAG: hypothetical protein ACTSPV_16905 [Candidatus Hodarchaeales archaeon]